ncbi:MAG: hypothetical protein ACJAS4_001062 [Bacteriovoracaceae bacterium]|jgi:hypothetical protein
MRTLILLFLFIGGLIFTGLTLSFITPYYLYNQVVNKNYKSRWFSLDVYSKNFLKPDLNIPFQRLNLPNNNFWQKFHYGDLHIPLPVKNPFYFVVPNLQYNKKTRRTKFGISILNSGNEKISEIFFLPNGKFPNYIGNQEVFELPLVRKEIINKSNDEVWKDVFTRDISEWKIDPEQMAYHLYLLQFRSKILKSNTKKFGFLNGLDKVVIDIEYPNKDYKAELIINKRGDSLYSFVIVSRKGNKDAKLIRYKFIQDMDYIESTPSLSDIIFREFKSLTYADQVDHTGMLYLLSAWSHNDSKKELIEQSIFFLERGQRNENQLKSLYKYYFDRYNEFFSKRRVKGLNMEEELQLQKNILHEADDENKNIKASITPEPIQKRDLDQEFNDLIEKSQIKTQKKAKVLRID